MTPEEYKLRRDSGENCEDLIAEHWDREKRKTYEWEEFWRKDRKYRILSYGLMAIGLMIIILIVMGYGSMTIGEFIDHVIKWVR